MEAAFEPAAFHLPFPQDFAPEPYESMMARASAVIGAAEAIHAHAAASGQSIDIPDDARIVSRAVFDGQQAPSAIKTTAQGLHLSALLNAYDIAVVESASQLRNLCINILIEKATTASSDSAQLRAVEMLGKVKDVALFEERSTVLVEHMSTEQIQASLRSKINTLYGKLSSVVKQATSEVVDVAVTEISHAQDRLPAAAVAQG